MMRLGHPLVRPLLASCCAALLWACASEIGTPSDVITPQDIAGHVPDATADSSAPDLPDGSGDPCARIECLPGTACRDGACVSSGIDGDGDGYPLDVDCNDLDPLVFPGAPEVCDGFDNDCDGRADEDFDADGDGFPTCVTFRPADCDDSDPTRHPNAVELCDGIDNNCNGLIDEQADLDGDGFTACDPDPARVDCDDTDPLRHPGAVERCDGRDNDCDGLIDEDAACVGCSDGQRDALEDLARWPTVAACKGTFGRGSLRRERTQTACGDDLGLACPAPEDLCAPGWHLCMRNGHSSDLRFRLTPQDCHALSEIYVAASNNCSNDPLVSPAQTGCDTSEPYGCNPTGWCSAPVACGPTETSHCAHAVWPNATRIFGLHAGRTENNGCGDISSDTTYPRQGKLAGVLCCQD